ncbi:MAG: hypothetical protein I8H90_22645 [Burkholderiales bacterium]|nr:hypothetical protein [Burkholderiales bacterium]MBH2071715.1 hypothetical protein [Burkholderiales bacterium]
MTKHFSLVANRQVSMIDPDSGEKSFGKPCIKCKSIKLLREFHMHAKMADGHINKCKKCAVEYALEYKEQHPDSAKANHKRWARTDSGKKKMRELMEKFPERELARRAVKKAIKDGVLKTQPCFLCGKKAQAHHPDYSRELDVVWLCSQHHSDAHQLAKNIPLPAEK